MNYTEWKQGFNKRTDLTPTSPFHGMPAYEQKARNRLFVYPQPFLEHVLEVFPAASVDRLEYDIRKKIGEDSLEELVCWVSYQGLAYLFIYEVRHTPTKSFGQHYVSVNKKLNNEQKDELFISRMKTLLTSFITENGYNRLGLLFNDPLAKQKER